MDKKSLSETLRQVLAEVFQEEAIRQQPAASPRKVVLRLELEGVSIDRLSVEVTTQ